MSDTLSDTPANNSAKPIRFSLGGQPSRCRPLDIEALKAIAATCYPEYVSPFQKSSTPVNHPSHCRPIDREQLKKIAEACYLQYVSPFTPLIG